MRAEILTIGDELCRGEVVDTNSSYLAAELWELGVVTTWMTSCRDEPADMRAAIEQAAGRAELVLVSGGLGPTTDDLTVEVLAAVAGVAVAEDPAARARMEARFARASYALTPNNLRQVRVPAGAESLGNPVGIAPGFTLRIGRATVYAMPGVPLELRAIWEGAVAPRVAAAVTGGERIARRVLRVFGLGESHIDHRLAGLVDGVPGATIHYQVAFPETLVKLVVRDPDADAAAARLASLEAEARARLGAAVYGVDRDSLPAALGRALAARGAKLVVAESCTGGMLGGLVTEVPGSSDYFLGGVITYANQAKTRDLGVRESTLAAHGAVSEAVAREMALGALGRGGGATLAVAITGIAGPDGGTPDKPVGTVHVAVAGAGGHVRHERFTFPGTREQVRRRASYWAMALVLRVLDEGWQSPPGGAS